MDEPGRAEVDREADLYRTIVDSVSDGVYLCDTDRRISFWSRGAERITGYTAEDMKGVSCAGGPLVHVDQRGSNLCDEACPLAQAMLDGQQHEIQAHVHRRHAGRLRAVYGRGNPQARQNLSSESYPAPHAAQRLN